MSKTRYIQIRVNQNQFERIKNNASAKGKKTTSDYARECMLEKSLVFERRFDELYEEVFKISRKLSGNKLI